MIADSKNARFLPPTDVIRTEVRAGLIVLIGFFGIFLGWAAFAPLDAAIVAPGFVTVAGDRQTIQHPEGGVISKLAVTEGQRVRAGDVLIELGAPAVVAQKEALASQVIDLQLERAQIQAEAARASVIAKPKEWETWPADERAQAEEAFARRNAIDGSSRSKAIMTEYGARIDGYQEQIAAGEKQEKLLREELDGMRTLQADQLVPMPRIRALERGLADLQGQRGALRASIAQAQEERAGQERKIVARLAELLPQLAAARTQVERTRMRAPVSGVVVGLSVHTVGGVLRPGEKAMDIVPDGQELVIEAQVRPDDADDLKAGMKVEARITAFHGRGLPTLNGTLKTISADRFVDERTGQGYFRATVSVPAKEVRMLTEAAHRPMKPGLPAQVVVPTRKRTALEYLLEPLNQALWRSFREG